MDFIDEVDLTFLMIRKLLDTPITVDVGGQYIVTIDYVES